MRQSCLGSVTMILSGLRLVRDRPSKSKYHVQLQLTAALLLDILLVVHFLDSTSIPTQDSTCTAPQVRRLQKLKNLGYLGIVAILP